MSAGLMPETIVWGQPSLYGPALSIENEDLVLGRLGEINGINTLAFNARARGD